MTDFRLRVPEVDDIPDAFGCIQTWLAEFDLSNLASFTVKVTKERGVFTNTGLCSYPQTFSRRQQIKLTPDQERRLRKSYSIICRVASCVFDIAGGTPRFLGCNAPDGTWPIWEEFSVGSEPLITERLPNGAIYPVDPKTGKRAIDDPQAVISLRGDSYFRRKFELVRYWSPGEVLIWIAGHEAFHFLRHSRQIPGKNFETQANRYGLEWLERYRNLMMLREALGE